MGFPSRDIERFNSALGSGAPSVDLFLENRSEFESVGKAAIAATLMPHEHENALKPEDQPRWYETLFALMADGPFEDNLLCVVTMIDRSRLSLPCIEKPLRDGRSQSRKSCHSSKVNRWPM
jgi:hypothetical protein